MKTQILKILFVMLVVLLGAAPVADAAIHGGLTQLRELTTQYVGQIHRLVEMINIQFVTVALVILILILIWALILRIATRWAVDFEIRYWTACKIMIIFSAISYIIRILLDILLAALTGIPAGLLLLCIIGFFAGFFAGSAICGRMITDPETSRPVGFVKGMLVFFYHLLIGFVLGITIAFLLIIAMLMELPLAIVSLFLIAALCLGFGAYVLPIAIKKASDWWAFLCGAQLLIGTFATIVGAICVSS